MTTDQQRAALEFMFAEFGKPIWWQPPSLTRAGNPQGNPPDLNIAEAESIFRLLAEKELIFPFINERREASFLLHHAKRPEWEALIAATRDIGFWERARTKALWPSLKWLGIFILWVSSIVISTWLSKNTENNLTEINKQLTELKAKVGH